LAIVLSSLFIRAVVNIVPIMLSFPAQNWKTAIDSTKKSDLPPGSRFGRSASLIVPRVYLSGYYTARDAEELSRLGITHVVSVLEYVPDIPDNIAAQNRLHVCVADQPEEYILAHFEETTEFIRSALAESKSNNVLVHCFMGVSRSATVVCAYLVATTTKDAAESIKFVQSQRGIVSPNLGFRKQLDEWSDRFVGNRPKRSDAPLSKFTGSIADRIRQLKGGGAPAPLAQVEAVNASVLNAS